MPQPPSTALWAKTAISAEPRMPLTAEIEADAIVIGAGFTGLRAALDLAEAGSRVVVLEAEDVAHGASGRSGGQVNPMLPFNTPAKLREMLGPIYFERLAEASLGSADALFDLIRTYQIDCQPRQNGWLRVLHNDRALRDAEASARDWGAFGAHMQLIEGEALAHLSGTRTYAKALLNPKGGAIQPLSFTRGLALAAESRGAKIYAHSAVTDLARQNGQWVARTAGGVVRADWAVVATNGYTGPLVPKLARSVMPITPIQIATDPLPSAIAESILPKGHTISDSRRVIMYARREPDGRMVFGGHGKLDAAGNLGGVDWVMRDAVRVFPQLKDIPWPHRWGGRIAVTKDHLPHLHEPAPGLVVGLGYNGRGVAISQVMGRTLAQRVLGTAPEDLTFPVTGITPIPGHRATLLAMGPMVAGMKLLDRIETG